MQRERDIQVSSISAPPPWVEETSLAERNKGSTAEDGNSLEPPQAGHVVGEVTRGIRETPVLVPASCEQGEGRQRAGAPGGKQSAPDDWEGFGAAKVGGRGGGRDQESQGGNDETLGSGLPSHPRQDSHEKGQAQGAEAGEPPRQERSKAAAITAFNPRGDGQLNGETTTPPLGPKTRGGARATRNDAEGATLSVELGSDRGMTFAATTAWDGWSMTAMGAEPGKAVCYQGGASGATREKAW